MKASLVFGFSSALIALTACTSTDRVQTQFYREAGSVIDSGHFGDATQNNAQYTTGEKSYAASLGNRFNKEVPTTVTFEFNSARLDQNARTVLAQQANFIRQFPEVRFRVYGHTDLVGSDAYNRRLGQRRANAVVRFLSSRGISRSRLEAVVSFGETQPVVNTQNRERKNRRAVTEVTGFVKRHPNVLDGKYAQIIYRDYVASAVAPEGLTGLGTLSGN
ncbi:MAG: OmpA family protein [Rhodobacteraceae bacterium]|nr:OmpA family protein [Paracoccaceae bacterium]